MNTVEQSQPVKVTNIRTVAGILLLLAGGVLFLDRYLKTGWLSLMILPGIGGFLYLWGVRLRHTGLIIAGALVAGLGAGGIAAWGPAVRLEPGSMVLVATPHSIWEQIGLITLAAGIAWGVIVLTTAALTPTPTWWALVPGGVLGALGYTMLYSPLGWVDFAFYLAVGTGLPLLIWGLLSRLLGLVIPGCLLIGIGPGIYLGWGSPEVGNTLVHTGIMLMGFAFGWALISLFSRRILNKSIWWPLIPGGILAMVGAGLYIGGAPSRALGFIGNTGSIALMIIGLYLLLMRKGIHH